MKEELTSRMWGLFDETGVFMAFCRHGFALIITDMVRSGEQYVHQPLQPFSTIYM
jgi:hypothetical protein